MMFPSSYREHHATDCDFLLGRCRRSGVVASAARKIYATYGTMGIDWPRWPIIRCPQYVGKYGLARHARRFGNDHHPSSPNLMSGSSQIDNWVIAALLLARIEDLRVYLLSLRDEQQNATQLQRSGTMSLCPEVQKFIGACEAIHGLLASGVPLTPDETGVIEMSASELLRKIRVAS